MYKPCSFNREEYLQNSEYFEEIVQDEGPGAYDCENELSEFNDDIESLAHELAYTRYKLALSEQLNDGGKILDAVNETMKEGMISTDEMIRIIQIIGDVYVLGWSINSLLKKSGYMFHEKVSC